MKIYGVFDKSRQSNELSSLLQRMDKQLNFYSYWDSNVYVTENIGVGHIYSDAANNNEQPIWNEAKNKFIVMAGRIFDYQKDKQELIAKGHRFSFPESDAEFILHGIEEWGDELIEKLNGFFVFILYDVENMRVQVVNDRCGMKPLYYFHSGSLLMVSSEIKAIIEDEKIKKKVNWKAWGDFFQYGFMLGNKTPFENIFSLPPATILTLDASGRFSLRRYWNYTQIQINRESSIEDFVHRGTQLLKQAIRRQAQSIDECTVLLSGGYDSRFIASAIKQFTNADFETFTTKPSLFLDSGRSIASRLFHYLDPVIAKEVAKALNVKNTFVPRSPNLYRKYLIEKVFLLDGMCLEHLWMLPVTEKLDNTKINFDGLAGDILLRGALITDEGLASIGKNKKLAHALDRQLQRYLGFPTEIITSLFKPPIREKLVSGVDTIAEEIREISDNDNAISIFHMQNRTKNSISLLPNNLINNRTCCLFPFLDKDLVEFSLTIPPELKVIAKIYGLMLADLFPEIMRIPSTTFLSIFSIKKWAKKYIITFPLSLLHFIVSSRNHSNSEDMDFVLRTLKSLTVPEYIDLNKTEILINECLKKNKDPMPFLVPIVEFCIWYNLFYLRKDMIHLKKQLEKRRE